MLNLHFVGSEAKNNFSAPKYRAMSHIPYLEINIFFHLLTACKIFSPDMEAEQSKMNTNSRSRFNSARCAGVKGRSN